jgi:hypothetical protein
MKLQYASFLLPLHSGSAEQDEMNRFLRGHRIVQTRKELASIDDVSCWAILVEYLDSPDKSIGDQQIKNKVDYKEILNAMDFSLFSKLREVRKKLAECMKIEGIGQGKADKYVPAFLECIGLQTNEEEQPTPI